MNWPYAHLLTSFAFILTLIFISEILRSRKSAGSSFAWLFLIIILPYIGIPLYIFFSTRKIGQKSNKKDIIFSSFSTGNKSIPSTLTQKILRASRMPDAQENNSLDLLEDGVKAYERIMYRIETAQESIYITTFMLSNDDVGKNVVKALTKKAVEGVKVFLLVDSLGEKFSNNPPFQNLKKYGGKISYFMPILSSMLRGRANLRNHRKLMIIDESFAIIGGMNLASEYMGPRPKSTRWQDIAAEISGPSVYDFIKIFVADWKYATGDNLKIGTRNIFKAGTAYAQVVASGPDVIGDPQYDLVFNSINRAEKNIWIVTPYFIPDESLTKALELAAKRGVCVNIVLPNSSNHFIADLARGSFIRQLENVGVNFKYFPRMLHAKIVIVDHALGVLGSANFDMRSLLLNYELGLVIYSQDELRLVHEWVLKTEKETFSIPLKTGLLRELAEGVGRILGPIL